MSGLSKKLEGSTDWGLGWGGSIWLLTESTGLILPDSVEPPGFTLLTLLAAAAFAFTFLIACYNHQCFLKSKG